MKMFNPSMVWFLDNDIKAKIETVKEIEAIKLNETDNLTQLLVFYKDF